MSTFIRKRVLQPINRYYIDIIMRLHGYILKTSKTNTRFYIPYVKTDYIQRQIYNYKNYYELTNLDYICNKWNNGIIGKRISDSIVLDIGANIGNHTLYFLNECNAKKVYSFEPVPDTFRILRRNIEINNVGDRSILVNSGVGEKTSKAQIESYDKKNTGSTTLQLAPEGDVNIIAIDDMDITDNIGLVKIDVEGFELPVIKGMIKTLDFHKPYICIEIRNYNFESIKDILFSLNYKQIELDSNSLYKDCLFYV